MVTDKPKLIFTGGHHTSSLAVARQLQSQGWEIIWIGHRHSMWGDKSDSLEYKEVVEAKISFYDLKAGKFYHTFHPLKLIRIPHGFLQAFILLMSLKLKFGQSLKGIVSFGGYIAVPVVICGWLLRIPSLTHEQTAVVGWANRLLSFFSSRIAVTWPAGLTVFPQSKTVLTGLPLRPEIETLQRAPNRQPRLLIMGGKQGSHIINQAVLSALPSLLPHYHVTHQLGSNSIYQDYQKALSLKSQLSPDLQSRYEPVDYLTNMQIAKAYQQAAVVVSRSGAHTVYELAHLKIPVVFIPIPWASHREQEINAGMLEKAGQAVIIPQSALTPQALIKAVEAAKSLKITGISVPADGLKKITKLITESFRTPNEKN